MAVIKNNFNAGELSPRLRYRTDLEKYASGCTTLKNFLVMPWGGVENRTGTEFIARCKYSDRPVRLMPFQFNIEQTYVIEAGDGYLRFFANGAPILGGDGNVYEIESPYSAADDLFQLRFCQSADTLFLVHPHYPPHWLRRSGHAEWTIEEIPIDGGPFMDENTTSTQVTASALTGDITVTATADLFSVDMVGELFEIVHPRKKSLLSVKFTSAATSSTMSVTGNWTITTSGGWYGTLLLQRSFDGGATWCDYRNWTSEGNINIDTSGYEEEKNAVYRLVMTNWSTPSSGVTYSCSVQLSCEDYWVYGIVRITGFTDAMTVSGTVIREIGSTQATADWAYGSFSSRNGYPSSVSFYHDRLVFAATAEQPQTVWYSRTSDYTDFLAGAGDEADDPLVYTIRAPQVNAISWMAARKMLMLGTQSAEGTLGPTDDSKAIAPDNREYLEKCLYGAAKMDCIRVADVTLFLERGGEYLRELAYNWSQDGYLAQNLTILSEHVLRGGVIDTVYQQLPYPVVWFVRADGVLVGFTYERLQNVTAWHRHETAGSFLSVTAIASGARDEVWVAVDRDGVRMVERFMPRTVTCAADGWFLDSALRLESDVAVSVISGLDHLEGRTDVTAMVDGNRITGLTVADGAVTLPQSGKNILIGLQYHSVLESMPLEVDTQQGSSMTIIKRITGVTVKYFESLGGTVSAVTTDGNKSNNRTVSEALVFRTADMDFSQPPELVTGGKTVPLPGSGGTEISIRITQDEPLPLTVLALCPKLSFKGEL